MNKSIDRVKVLHLTFLGILSIFIYFYFAEYKPLKLHTECAQNSARAVLASDNKTDAYDLYQKLYDSCMLRLSLNPF